MGRGKVGDGIRMNRGKFWMDVVGVLARFYVLRKLMGVQIFAAVLHSSLE